MKVDVLVAEIGSTTTVVNAFIGLNTDNPEFWGQGQAPTSVMEGDVRVGLQGAIQDLCRKKGLAPQETLEYEEMLATSSAAGGLKMTVHGLVYDMTAKAAKEAALGAGGIIHYITAGRLRRTDLAKIQEINPNLILIAGGVDFGERETALDNAEMIKGLGLSAPVIYAGNIENQEEMRLIFGEPVAPTAAGASEVQPAGNVAGAASTASAASAPGSSAEVQPAAATPAQQLYIVDNVYPKIDELNVEPCRKVIQDAFEQHITNAPGMEHVRDMVNGPIIPTPGAVMQATKVLYDCLGDLIVLDVGGATTDLHSVAIESDKVARLMISPEPKAKRTVEGDLGVYVNRYKVIESIGEEKLRERCLKEGIDMDRVLETYVAIPKTEEEIKFVEILTEEAVIRATERHAGALRYIYGPSGRSTVAEGKDLTQVKYIVGTGGALTRLPHRIDIMKEIARHNETGLKLFPTEHAEILVDNDYIMASLGVLSTRYREAAIKLMEKSLGITFPEKKAPSIPTGVSAALQEAEMLAQEAEAKEHEYQAHLDEMEGMGYDMSDYREPPAVVSDPEELRKQVEEAAEAAAKSEPAAKAAEAAAKSEAAVKATASMTEAELEAARDAMGCTKECHRCIRTQCPYRKKSV